MAINIFEGARRISKLVIVIWIVISDIRYWDDRLIVLASYVIRGSLFIWAFTWSIGCIVRGFMGIPNGQDKK